MVASTYCNSWIFDAFDPKEPFESMARAYTELFIVRDESFKEWYMDKWIRISILTVSSSMTLRHARTIPITDIQCLNEWPSGLVSLPSLSTVTSMICAVIPKRTD